jgi:hypothetical protein
MKHFYPFLSKVIAIWMDFWIMFPVVLTVFLSAGLNMQLSAFIAFLSGAYVSGMILRRLLIRKNKLLTIIITLILCIGFSILFGKGISNTVVLALLTFVTACRSISIVENPLHISFPRVYTYTALFVYFLAFYLYGKIVVLKEFQSYILYAGLIMVPSTFLLINSEVLMQASRAELKESSSMPIVKRNNRILTILLIIVGFVIAGYNTLKEIVVNAVQAVILFLLRLIESIMNLLNTPLKGQPTPGEPGMPMLPPAEAAEISPFWEMVSTVLGYLALIIAGIGFIFLLGKVLVKLFKFIVELVKRLMAQSNWTGEIYGYSDEKESLIDWQAIKNSYAEGFKEWLERIFNNEPRWGQLTDNSQRVRYLYRHLVLRAIGTGYSFKASRTPDETIKDLADHDRLEKELQPLMEDLYGRARYGDGEIGTEEVLELKRDLKL